MLLPKIQRTKVESKSQPMIYTHVSKKGCYQKYKEQKLKANHNNKAKARINPGFWGKVALFPMWHATHNLWGCY